MAERRFEPNFSPPLGAKVNPYGLDIPGFLTWKNKHNGFFVAACHYTADPQKRSEEWFRATTKQMRPDQISREMEIDFSARGGLKAFDYLNENPMRWRVPNMELSKIPKNWRIIASLDYGTTNPTAIYFYAIDPMRRVYVCYEFYKPSSAREIAAVLKGAHKGVNMKGIYTDFTHPLWRRCEKVVVDGAIFNENQDHGGEKLISVGDILQEQYGIPNMERAHKAREAGLERVKDMLAPNLLDPEKKPSLFFCERIKHLWEELNGLVYEELPPHLLMNKNQKEDVVAKDDHGYDSLRYALMSIQVPSDELPPAEPEAGTLAAVESEWDLSDSRKSEVDWF